MQARGPILVAPEPTTTKRKKPSIIGPTPSALLLCTNQSRASAIVQPHSNLVKGGRGTSRRSTSVRRTFCSSTLPRLRMLPWYLSLFALATRFDVTYTHVAELATV